MFNNFACIIIGNINRINLKKDKWKVNNKSIKVKYADTIFRETVKSFAISVKKYSLANSAMTRSTSRNLNKKISMK